MEWIEWDEPFGRGNEGRTLNLVCRVTAKDAIKSMLNRHPGVYDTDERALEDFIAVHWAARKEYP